MSGARQGDNRFEVLQLNVNEEKLIIAQRSTGTPQSCSHCQFVNQKWFYQGLYGSGLAYQFQNQRRRPLLATVEKQKQL